MDLRLLDFDDDLVDRLSDDEVDCIGADGDSGVDFRLLLFDDVAVEALPDDELDCLTDDDVDCLSGGGDSGIDFWLLDLDDDDVDRLPDDGVKSLGGDGVNFLIGGVVACFGGDGVSRFEDDDDDDDRGTSGGSGVSEVVGQRDICQRWFLRLFRVEPSASATALAFLLSPRGASSVSDVARRVAPLVLGRGSGPSQLYSSAPTASAFALYSAMMRSKIVSLMRILGACSRRSTSSCQVRYRRPSSNKYSQASPIAEKLFSVNFPSTANPI